MTVTFTDVFKVIFAILLPPLGVFMEVGASSWKSGLQAPSR
jgi:uncharacterized membrane protein YqaE (UPF0057 family)